MLEGVISKTEYPPTFPSIEIGADIFNSQGELVDAETLLQLIGEKYQLSETNGLAPVVHYFIDQMQQLLLMNSIGEYTRNNIKRSLLSILQDAIEVQMQMAELVKSQPYLPEEYLL